MPSFGEGVFGAGIFGYGVAPVVEGGGGTPPGVAALPPDAELVIHWRTATHDLRGQLSTFRRFDAVLRWNDVSTWALELPMAMTPPELLEPMAGIIVTRGDEVLLSGPCNDVDVDSRADFVHLGGVDDLHVLADRDAWPGAPTPQGDGSDRFLVDDALTYTGPASTVLLDLIADNAGPGDFHGEPVADLVLPADPLLGATVTWSVRFDHLLETLQGVALAGGDLGFRIVQTPGSPDLVLEVFESRDLSDTIRLGTEFDNLESFKYRRARPIVTHTLVAGQGEGTARMVVRQAAPDAGTWGRVDKFVDRRSSPTVAELQAAAEETIAKGGARYGLTISLPPDTAWIDPRVPRYGRDFRLGDIVTVEALGVAFVETIREVRINMGAGPPTIIPALTSPHAAGLTGPDDRGIVESIFDRLRRTETRAHNIEARR